MNRLYKTLSVHKYCTWFQHHRYIDCSRSPLSIFRFSVLECHVENISWKSRSWTRCVTGGNIDNCIPGAMIIRLISTCLLHAMTQIELINNNRILPMFLDARKLKKLYLTMIMLPRRCNRAHRCTTFTDTRIIFRSALFNLLLFNFNLF